MPFRVTLKLSTCRPVSFFLLLTVFLTVSCAQSGGKGQPLPTETPGSDPTPNAIPTSPTVTPQPTPSTPEPTVTATPAPTPRTILSTSSTDGEAAPDFEVETFDGETLKLSDLNGKVVVLNFWASWCPPCRWEMPFFETMWQEYQEQGVVFLGIAMSDTLENVKAFAEEAGVTYPVALDTTTEIARDYEVLTLPTTYFIGKDGNIERKLTSAANEGLLKVFLRGQLRRE